MQLLTCAGMGIYTGIGAANMAGCAAAMVGGKLACPQISSARYELGLIFAAYLTIASSAALQPCLRAAFCVSFSPVKILSDNPPLRREGAWHVFSQLGCIARASSASFSGRGRQLRTAPPFSGFVSPICMC